MKPARLDPFARVRRIAKGLLPVLDRWEADLVQGGELRSEHSRAARAGLEELGREIAALRARSGH